MRYFRCEAGDEAYEQARAALDAAWGHPNLATKTMTCIQPAATAPHDSQGRIVLAVDTAFTEYPAASQMLMYMTQQGAVAEITEAEYRAALQQQPA
jgi:hypothetical protein